MSAFPYSVALDLGITDDELLQTKAGARGLGSQEKAVPAWRAKHITINARVIAVLPDAAKPFGPLFPLNPVFLKDTDRMLLGRADFFNAFSVSFPKPVLGSKFILAY